MYMDESGSLNGHNTDGGGLLVDLTKNLQLSLAGKKIIVLGAGGATRGILQPLIEQVPESLTIINRTQSKAQTLADEFADLYRLDTMAADNIADNLGAADLMINATSASLDAKLPISDGLIISSETVCYDLSYALEPTRFLQWTKENGCQQNHDGRGMLVEQAALAFTTWTSLEADTTSLINNFTELCT